MRDWHWLCAFWSWERAPSAWTVSTANASNTNSRRPVSQHTGVLFRWGNGENHRVQEQTESSCPSSGQIYPAHETDLFILYKLPVESRCLGSEASMQSMSCQDPETKLMTLKPDILSSQRYCWTFNQNYNNRSLLWKLYCTCLLYCGDTFCHILSSIMLTAQPVWNLNINKHLLPLVILCKITSPDFTV